MNAGPTPRPVILLTGFEPFLAITHNASADLAKDVANAARRHLPRHDVVAHVLPTRWIEGPAALRRLYDEWRPDIAVHFGVSSEADGFTIETRGLNVACEVADAGGDLPAAPCLQPAGPDAHSVTLPVRLILGRLRALGLPARLSRDAGGYICNAVLYAALSRRAGHHVPRRCGFIHVPASLGMHHGPRCAGRTTTLTREDAVAGGLAILEETLRARRQPVRRAPVTAASG